MRPLLLLAFALPACCESPLCGEGQAALDLPDGGDLLYQDSAILDLSIELGPGAAEGLAVSTWDEVPDVAATLRYEDRSWEAGLKLKGGRSFRALDEKAAFKLDLQEFGGDETFFGARRLTLNNMVQDASKLSENLAYRLMTAMGVPAPRHGYACVQVDGEDYGLYSAIETMDEQFLERNWDDPSGNLYEGGGRADVVPGMMENFQIQEQGLPLQRLDLQDLSDALNAADEDTWLQTLETYFDADALLAMWAVDLVVGNVDGYLTHTTNYHLYHEPAAQRWWMIPWGMDQAFAADLDVHDPGEVGGDGPGRIYRGCAASAPCAAALDAKIEETLAQIESMDLAGIAAAERDRICELSRGDPRGEQRRGAVRRAQGDVIDFIDRRPDDVRDQLEAR